MTMGTVDIFFIAIAIVYTETQDYRWFNNILPVTVTVLEGLRRLALMWHINTPFSLFGASLPLSPAMPEQPLCYSFLPSRQGKLKAFPNFYSDGW